MTHEAKAVELLHRVMEISMLHGPDIWHTVDLEWGALLNEIEAFLTEIESEARDSLQK